MANKIPPKNRESVYERAWFQCELCGSTHGLQIHHITGRHSHRLENLILICWEHHHGTNGVHGKNGKELDLRLKIELQEKYEAQGYEEDELRELMGGKLYKGCA